MSNHTKRSDAGRNKFGSKEKGTDAAHKLSFDAHNEINASKPGPKTTDHQTVVRDLNSDGNLRIKTQSGNRSTDTKNDNLIIHAYMSNDPIHRAAEDRVVQAYKGSQNAESADVQRTHKIIGEMTVENGKPGPNPKVKNLAK